MKDSSIETRSSLLYRIRTVDDQAAWHEFAQTYNGLVRRLALGAQLTHHEAEEVIQDVLISVARHIRTFEYNRRRCSFKHWLSRIVRWRITDQNRKRIARELLTRIAEDTS